MMESPRRWLTVVAWIALTVFVASMLVTKHKSVLPVVCDVVVVAVGLLTVASLLRGHDPWWIETRKARRAARKRARSE
jgi:hypothetical protein